MASYGTPLSSMPNTSYLNVTEPVSSAGFGGGAVGAAGASMDPLTMGAISAVGQLGAAGIGGMFQQNAQRAAINSAEENDIINRAWQLVSDERSKGNEIESLFSGYGFMQGPTFQNYSKQAFGKNLAGRYSPKMAAIYSRMF
jgi:hypothetical protein